MSQYSAGFSSTAGVRLPARDSKVEESEKTTWSFNNNDCVEAKWNANIKVNSGFSKLNYSIIPNHLQWKM